ncbi:hypothetical protein EJ110_NYTH13284 [Nymphaea thermarum]|nr:hypothetical protein EJ110_NYTH13284 [Nymphaea thermarum]
MVEAIKSTQFHFNTPINSCQVVNANYESLWVSHAIICPQWTKHAKKCVGKDYFVSIVLPEDELPIIKRDADGQNLVLLPLGPTSSMPNNEPYPSARLRRDEPSLSKSSSQPNRDRLARH